ncbi:MAG: 3-methyl-2-oxobutanoate hydroxymethyltransferase [Spirochaetia bacterium]
MKKTADLFTMKKNRNKISMLTAYDYQTAKLLESAGIDIILVGDSLGNVFQGKGTTRKVTMEHMLYHTEAVARGAKNTYIVSDMPYKSYETPDSAIKHAKLLLEAGAHAVKYEGSFPVILSALRTENIEVMGHLGLLPQTAEAFKVQGKEEARAKEILANAKTMAEGGVFSLVLECVPEGLAKTISQEIDVPVIGIGAGSFCDGQVLVVNDLLNIEDSKKPKFVKAYADLSSVIQNAVSEYIAEVKAKSFPGDEHTYH